MDTIFKRTMWRHWRVKKSLEKLEWIYPLTEGSLLWESCSVQHSHQGTLSEGGSVECNQEVSATLVKERLGEVETATIYGNWGRPEKEGETMQEPQTVYELTLDLSWATNYACQGEITGVQGKQQMVLKESS